MRLDHGVTQVLKKLLGRLLWRALAFALIAIFALAAIYEFTVAGTLQLANHYDVVTARLIVGTVFVALATAIFLALWATRGPRLPKDLRGPGRRDVRLAMLVESVLLGFSFARNRSRQL